MWIKIKYRDRKEIINGDRISKICLIEDTLYINYQHKEFSKFIFESVNEANAWYQGMELALNGIDYFVESIDDLSPDYIKPLFQSKNEAFHRHLMLKEILTENI